MVAGCKTFKSIRSLERQCESFTLKRGCPTQLRLHIFIILTEVLILLFIVRRTCILKGDPMFDLHIFVVYHVIPGKWMISCREQKTGVEYKTGSVCEIRMMCRSYLQLPPVYPIYAYVNWQRHM